MELSVSRQNKRKSATRASEQLHVIPRSSAAPRGLLTPRLALLPWKSASALHPGSEKFGSPGYPSPLDRLRPWQRNSPLGGNASFSHPPKEKDVNLVNLKAASASSLTCSPGNGLHSFSFSPGLSRGSFRTPSKNDGVLGYGGHWLYRNYIGGGTSGTVFPTSILNPNKAVLTLNASTLILTANEMASMLLGYSGEELCGKMKLTDLLVSSESIAVSSDSESLPHHESSSHDSGCEETEDSSLQALLEKDVIDSQGTVVFSGKVVEMRTAESTQLPVSLWMKQLPGEMEDEEEQRWVAVLEPVDVTESKAHISITGQILEHEDTLASLFCYDAGTSLVQTSILQLIPSLKLPQSINNIPKNVFKQQCTGHTVDGATFPLCTRLKPAKYSDKQGNTIDVLNLKIRVFANISGLVVLDETGRIVDYNHNFTRFFFGYGKGELEKMSISHLIPTFFEDVALIKSIDCPSFDEDDSDYENLDDNSESNIKNTVKSSVTASTQSTDASSISTPNKAFIATNSTIVSNCSSHWSDNTTDASKAMRDITNSLNVLNISSQQTGNSGLSNNIGSGEPRSPVKGRTGKRHINQKPLTPAAQVHIDSCQDLMGDSVSMDVMTSTPASRYMKGSSQTIEEGSFFGIGRHKDGSDIGILYQIRRLEISGFPVQFCVWILRDPEEPGEGLRSHSNLTGTSSVGNTVDISLGHAIQQKSSKHTHSSNTDSDEDDCTSKTSTDGSSSGEYSLNHSRRALRDSSKVIGEEEDLLAGEYSKHYTVLRQIGKGAFGSVKMSYRNEDGLMVVTKFIRKSKVYQDSWVDDAVLGTRVPLEVSLLMTLNHPNIVSVHDVFENDQYFHLVMEKWGAGLDLFEFIDRNPLLDEPLASYIFRQIVSALEYLHSLNIVHRDVKDENVIINQNFCIKLIDFGSAAFTKSGKLFSQFAGTVEYCSPEVLRGIQYSGHELEVWSLGITLYTLLYGENPFYNIDDTITAPLSFPYKVSQSVSSLLLGMLEKNPSSRMSLEEVAKHSWTQIPCEISEYNFKDIVKCSEEEANPKQFVYEYGESEAESEAASLSNVSQSFVIENTSAIRRSLSFSPQQSVRDDNEAWRQRSATSLSSSRLASQLSEDNEELHSVTASSSTSKTGTSDSMTSVSTVTIDSEYSGLSHSESSSSLTSEATEHSLTTSDMDEGSESVVVTTYENHAVVGGYSLLHESENDLESHELHEEDTDCSTTSSDLEDLQLESSVKD